MSEAVRQGSEAAIARFLVEQIATLYRREVASIDPDRPFIELGIDSLDAMSLAGDIQEHFAIDMDPSEFFDHPTPNHLARMIAARLGH